MSVAEDATVEVCASVNAVYPTRERDIALMFTLTPESMFASKSDSPGKTDIGRASYSSSFCASVHHHFMF